MSQNNFLLVFLGCQHRTSACSAFVASHDSSSLTDHALTTQDLESSLGVEAIVEENARHVAELTLQVQYH